MPIRPNVGQVSTPQAERAAGEVRAALARRQITQTRLAQETGRSQAYWSRRLSGERPMDVADLEVVASLTGTSISVLVAEPEEAAS